MVSFPYDLTIIPGLIIITIAILEARRNQKEKQSITEEKGIMVMPVIIVLTIAVVSYVHYFVESEESQESITNIIRWISVISSLVLLILYIRKRPIRLKQRKSP